LKYHGSGCEGGLLGGYGSTGTVGVLDGATDGVKDGTCDGGRLVVGAGDGTADTEGADVGSKVLAYQASSLTRYEFLFGSIGIRLWYSGMSLQVRPATLAMRCTKTTPNSGKSTVISVVETPG